MFALPASWLPAESRYRSALLRSRRATSPAPHNNPAIFAARLPGVKRGPARLLLLIAIVVSGSCAPSRPPGVYPVGSQQPLPLVLQGIMGVRDGGRMAATATFSGDQGGRLVIEMQLEIGVPTRLTRGSYSRESPEGSESGDVAARSITFLGGQSDWPNLGASLELRQQDQVRYLVRFPPTPVVAER